MKGTILVATAGQGILRSVDNGASWHRLGLKEAIEFDGTVRALAVDPACRELGIGAALMQQALAAARARGHAAVILLGDAPYYARFGFSTEKTGALVLPGPFERDRLLAIEFTDGALDGAEGQIVPTGAALAKRWVVRALQAHAA